VCPEAVVAERGVAEAEVAGVIPVVAEKVVVSQVVAEKAVVIPVAAEKVVETQVVAEKAVVIPVAAEKVVETQVAAEKAEAIPVAEAETVVSPCPSVKTNRRGCCRRPHHGTTDTQTGRLQARCHWPV
jgi:hypothetical protein